jgi:membrane associated rhomboid family serine protease
VLPLKDTIPTRRFPALTVAFIAANVGVWLFIQGAGGEPGFSQSLTELAYRPCEVDESCADVGESWPVNAFTAMFMHGGWAHLLGNMLFLWIFGNNIEDELGRIRFVVFYLAGGLAATAAQTFVTLGWGSAEDATIPNVGASGAIAAVLGAYILLHPRSLVLTWIAPIFLVPIPAFLYLGIWFGLQLLEGSTSFTSPEEGGGIAYFAHIGGFVFGAATVRLFQAGHDPREAW